MPPRSLTSLSLALLLLAGCSAPEPYQPKLAKASSEARRQVGALWLAPGFEASLWAAEPALANPVAFWMDGSRRCFVAETFRQETAGVPDNRAHPEWLDDDLASQTVADRERMYLRHHPEYAREWTRAPDRIRLLEDRDGDGRAETSTVYADGFDDLLDGTGAGLIARGSELWYTCIPHLWRLRDRDGDGRADERTRLHSGFGVRVALRGHDMHGLRFGPDGRLYFSIGDRGYHVQTADGLLHDPRSGAVFRCNPDGSQLEVFATGLRNPQELAFDDHGNLFTGDNNSDGGDRARIVYVAEGSDAGWRMNFQYLPRRGPWIRERWSSPKHEGQAAFLVPPLFHLGSGPSGLASYPGTGLPERYRGAFFMCDFLGDRLHSGVRVFRVDPDGAGFKRRDDGWLVRNVLPTDVDFSTDGSVFVSDWVFGWTGEGKGRLVRLRHPTWAGGALVDETRRLLEGGLANKDVAALVRLLDHADRRVRQEAQFALAERGARRALLRRAGEKHGLPGRLHALWALEQIARREQGALDFLIPFLADRQPEVRAQAARLLGEGSCPAAVPALLRGLADARPRVVFFSAWALGRHAALPAFTPLVNILRRNRDQDPYLRHAATLALARIARAHGAGPLVALATHASEAVRTGAVVALRRLADERVARFLDDPSSRVAAEAARAIYDLPIADALPELAARLEHMRFAGRRLLPGEPFARRALGANDLLGGARSAERLAAFAARRDAPLELRALALRMLREWDPAPLRDFVLNFTRPRPDRDRADAERAVAGSLPVLLGPGPERVRQRAAELAGAFGLRSAADELVALFRDGRAGSRPRRAALLALQDCGAGDLPALAREALASSSPRLRGAGARVLARHDPALAVPVLRAAAEGKRLVERQLALQTLGEMGDASSEALLVTWMERALAGDVPPGLQLDVLEAARARKSSKALAALLERRASSLPEKDPVAVRRVCLEGGDPRRGRAVFRRFELSCTRCHSLGKRRPAQAGPDLADIGVRRDRAYILASIVDPNREIAQGFGTAVVETTEDDDYSGVILEETPERLVLEINETGSPERIEIRKTDIASREPGRSSMPGDLAERITLGDLRDLVEFLARQRGKVDTDEDPLGPDPDR